LSATKSTVTVPIAGTTTVSLRGSRRAVGHDLKRVAVQVHRVPHHRVVLQHQPDALALATGSVTPSSLGASMPHW
jgi:hypothetical protein